jgi:hypothetical protein
MTQLYGDPRQCRASELPQCSRLRAKDLLTLEHQPIIARLGPYSLILLTLMAALAAVCVIFLFVGLVPLWIPVFVILMAASIIAVLVRRHLRR